MFTSHSRQRSSLFLASTVEVYHETGFVVLKLFDESQVGMLEKFARDWVYRLLAPWTADREHQFPLKTYHIWSQSLSIDHGSIFCAQNRHTCPRTEVEKTLINGRLKSFLHQIGLEQYRIWDEGLGWLAFRFIRPGAGDGYPLSRKEWGVARNVVSCWVPVIGYSPRETLTLVPGSHLREYEKCLPTDDKFCRGEYRLSPIYADLELYRPQLERGEVVIYHPRMLHSEDVAASEVTRLNLEFRIELLPPPIQEHA